MSVYIKKTNDSHSFARIKHEQWHNGRVHTAVDDEAHLMKASSEITTVPQQLGNPRFA